MYLESVKKQTFPKPRCFINTRKASPINKIIVITIVIKYE